MASHNVTVLNRSPFTLDRPNEPVNTTELVTWTDTAVVAGEILVADSKHPDLNFTFTGLPGASSVTGTISYPTGSKPKVHVPYSLYVERGGTKTRLGGGFLVIDNMGGMTPQPTPQPPENDDSDDDDQRHHDHGDRG